MPLLGASLVAWAGVYSYVALYYGALYLRRRHQVEYRVFAALCACLGVVSLASGLTMAASSPAQAAGAQHLQFLGLLPALAFFVDFSLRLSGERWPKVVHASYAWAWLGAGAATARMFVNPGFADPLYDWSYGGPSNRAIGELTPLGLTFALGALLFSSFALARLVVAARGRRDLRIAAAATAFGLAGGAFDLAARIFDLTPIHLASHTALVPILGFGYVLVGRFTSVDEKLAVRTEELARSYDHLRLTQEALVKKEQLAAVGELSAVIAHEVRNPLAIIKNAVSGLRRPELPPVDGETLLGILDEETDRLNHLVNDLLAYAKPISPEARAVDMRTLVMHAVELAAGGNRGLSQMEIELELDEEVDDVLGDETLLRHALLNIVDNALQAMPQGGTLTVSCRNATIDGRACVAVDFHDTGEGMDTLVRSRARDPFFTTRQTGTGLGLAIVDRVARAHGGRVELESRHGQGTTVSFVIPCERSSQAPDEG